VIELLRRVAQQTPDHPAVIDNDTTTTYGTLLANAEAFAAYLASAGIARFGALSYDADDVVAILAGASLAGAEACLYPVIESPEGLAEYAERFDHDLVITNHADVVGGVRTIDPAECFAHQESVSGEPPTARPLLVLTTGTTGLPRGVRHDWARVLRPVMSAEPAPHERWLLAYGLNQFGGLQIVLHVFGVGATLVAPKPRRPREGLAAMRAEGVTHASGTPTFWRFLLAEMKSDGGEVPDLQQITLGGEAVPPYLIDTLTETFSHARVSQIYAASEFGSSGSVRDNRNGLPLSVLERPESADVQMKIVDGELWVKSQVGMLGYYGEDPVDANAWRATGDLVEIIDDRIVFQGRQSDVINVGGVKVHPLLVEERITKVPGVAMARVYGRTSPVAGAIVAVEVVAEPDADTDEVDAAIREACEDLVAAARPRSIRFVDIIATAGNKVVRRTQ
jgi:acyl-CoA synthetase (AMP-forming)/AMP-acid ligase II